ncbi:tRNA(Ile)-lysidine synthase [Geothermobacter ehrlichii]|uniref:tRNA(Ile)-lysidine synthase n=1 Tax=Geothermobacter ehrlichii TaxID=213224 RepID=A0A5D3WEI8_9BACT|nr:tRNA lysidine(34) synthetase TilS [Geothermobacter ehrlichii]TYO95685.1 tRNA(Ile)-lysidine synthase [Geothermobacter ehrlichii]
MEKVLPSFLDRLQRCCGVEPGDGIVVACSGGADSTALLTLLVEAADRLGLRLQVAHLDHGLRLESGDDARFVAELAAGFDLPFFQRRVDVAEVAERMAENLEAAGRRLRREFLREVADRTGARFIALGHHRDDQAETVLFRLLRGSGSTGLRGMAWSDPPFIRPLLGFRRRQLRSLLRSQGISWREDASNRDLGRARNLLRHRVLPLLTELQPDVVDKLADFAARTAIDEDDWRRRVEAWLARHAAPEKEGLCLELPALRSCHEALRLRIWLAALRRVAGRQTDLTSVHLAACDNLLSGRPQAEIHLPSLWVGRRYQAILIRRRPPEPATSWEVFIDGPGRYMLPTGGELLVSVEEGPAGETGGVAEFALAETPFPLRARNRRPGDRFHPAGAPGGRKLKDFFIDAKIPRERRDALPLLLSDDTILWVVGLRRCEGRRPHAGAKTLKVAFSEGESG